MDELERGIAKSRRERRISAHSRPKKSLHAKRDKGSMELLAQPSGSAEKIDSSRPRVVDIYEELDEDEDFSCEGYLVDGICPKSRYLTDECPLNITNKGYKMCCIRKEKTIDNHLDL